MTDIGYAQSLMIIVQVCIHTNHKIWHNQTANEHLPFITQPFLGYWLLNSRAAKAHRGFWIINRSLHKL